MFLRQKLIKCQNLTTNPFEFRSSRTFCDVYFESGVFDFEGIKIYRYAHKLMRIYLERQ